MNEFCAQQMFGFFSQFGNCDVTVSPFFNDGEITYTVCAQFELDGDDIVIYPNNFYNMEIIATNDNFAHYMDDIFTILVKYIDYATIWANDKYHDITSFTTNTNIANKMIVTFNK